MSSSAPRPLGLKLLLLLLLPLSWCYSFALQLRNRAFDRKLLSSYPSSLPIVSVGNIAVGGTGKTPTVDWLVKGFAGQGKRAAIISRGYGGSYREAAAVVSDGCQMTMTADQCGDEPLLLARRNPGCPVVVARRRTEGVRYVEDHFDVDVIVLDDAFQHRRLARDFDLVLLDATDPFGNGWTLPAGKLRERKSALNRADALLLTRSTEKADLPNLRLPTFHSRHCLSSMVTDLEGTTCDVNKLNNKKVYAFAGLADNQRFFEGLSSLGIVPVRNRSLPDHVAYVPEVLRSIATEAAGCDVLLTTEKDAVKLSDNMFELPCYYVCLHLDIVEGGELMQLINRRLWRQK